MTTTHLGPEEVMAWVDGELTADEAKTVAAHVEACAECAGVAAGFRRMSEELREWKVAEVSSRVEAGLMSAAAGAEKRVTPWSPFSSFRANVGHPKLWRWGMGLGGAVAAVALLVVLSPRSRQGDSYLYSRQQQSESLVHQPSPGLTMDAPTSEMDAKLQSAQSAAVVSEIDEGLHAPQKLARAHAQMSENLKNVGTAGGGGAPSPVAGRTPSYVDAAITPMIARTVSLTVRVKDVEQARPTVEALLARHHGYMAQMNASSADGSARGFTASLRIPAAELGAALKELRGLGRVDNESQGGEEVTQQHQDLVARLKNARETEARMQAILEQRTGRLSDVLEVEQEIARVRGEIESMEADEVALDHRVDFASVDLTLVEEYKAQFAAPDSVGTRVRNAFVAGYRNAWETVLGLVLFVEEFGPALLVWALLLALPAVWVWRRYRRILRAH